ncbi:hypothetical protein FPV67DRAFT_342659 [Lyophyllum atratum]|nr:hypothetical protein FPV67DRAFT_342659 [Lyophyllum atratum]
MVVVPRASVVLSMGRVVTGVHKCCFRQNWCYRGGCCPRTQIGCDGSCCSSGLGCCETTTLYASDKRIKYTGGWANAISSCQAWYGETTKATTASATSISFSFNGTGMWLNAKQSTYTVIFSGYNYPMTSRNVTGDCDIGWSRTQLPYNEYRIDVFPHTESRPFELISFSVQQMDKFAVKATTTSTKTSFSTTGTPTQSSSAASWMKSAGTLDRLLGPLAGMLFGLVL